MRDAAADTLAAEAVRQDLCSRVEARLSAYRLALASVDSAIRSASLAFDRADAAGRELEEAAERLARTMGLHYYPLALGGGHRQARAAFGEGRYLGAARHVQLAGLEELLKEA